MALNSLHVERAAHNILKPGERVASIYPATPLQADLINATERNANAYTGIGIWDIQCRIESATIQAAWAAVVSANSILRSQFIITSEGTYRVEIEDVNIERTCLHIEIWDGSSSVDALQQRLEANLAEKASISGTPLVTAAAVHRSESDETRFVLRMHHSLYDGDTFQMIISDILIFLSGSLSPRRPQYSKFNAFVSTQDNIRVRGDTQAFWTAYLAGANMDQRSEDVAISGRRMMHSDKRALGAYDPQFSLVKFGVTFPNLLRAAWALTLSTVQGGTDHVFGEVFSGRDKTVADIDRIMGPTITTVPFRVQHQESQIFSDFLSSIQNGYVDILPHSQVSPVDLATWLQTSPGKLFPSFIAINLQPKVTEIDGRRAVFTHVPDHIEFQLAAFFDVIDDTIYATLAYDLNIVSDERARTILEVLASTFETLHTTPADASVSHFVEARVGAQVVSFESGMKNILHFELAHDAFEYMATKIPDSIAGEHGSEIITYRQLQEQSTKLARYLFHLGVTPGTMVPVIIRRELSMLVAILAVLKAGGAFIPIATETPTARIRHIVKESGSQVLLATSTTALEEHEEIREHLAHVVIVGSQSWSQDSSDGPQLPRPSAASIAYAIATSGTTGVPKLVLCPHQGVVNVVHDALGNISFGVGSRVGSFMGVAFDCSVGEIFSALSHGATLVLRRDDVKWASIIATLDSLFITPTGLQLVKPQSFPSLRRISVAGEAVPPALVRAWQQANPKLLLTNMYGPSEATIFCTAAALGLEEVTIGRPIQNMICRILSDDLKRVPMNVNGELYVGGIGLASGYLNNLELTARKFIEDPFSPGRTLYATGDVASWGTSGELYYHGRKDASLDIKIRGHRVNLDEISHTISKHPSVQFCVTIVKNESIVTFISPANINVPAVRDACALLLPHYMIPTKFQPIEQTLLPVNLNGKVDKQALTLLVMEAPSGASASPSSPVARAIAAVWADVLEVNLDVIKMETSFFELGNSISATRVVRKLASEGLKLSTSQLFRYQTVEELERFLLSKSAPLVETKSDGFDCEYGPTVLLPYELPHDAFERMARQHPDAVAVELGQQQLTYRELDSMSTELAHYLNDLGATTDMIPIIVHRESSMLIAILAVLKAGGAYIPVDAHAPSTRVQHILTQSDANVVIVNSQRAAEDHWELLGKVRHVVVESFEFRGSGRYTRRTLPRAAPTDTAYAIATSGTTGVPKLVCCPHQGVVNIVEWMNNLDDGLVLGVGSRVGNFAGIAFDASILDIFTALSRGATLVLRDDSVDWATVIATLDVFNMTPTALQMVKPQVFPRLKRIILGGEALPSSLIRAWKGLVPSMVNGYGPSETSIVITTSSMKFDESDVPIGAPIQNSFCRILNADRQRVAFGEVGELYLGGTGVGAGYLHNPELTSRCFVADPYAFNQVVYATGDLAKWGADGKLYYCGRKDVSEDVKVRGHRVNLDEIAQVLLQYPAVQFAKALVSSDSIVAFIAPENVNVGVLRESCTKVLPYYMVPATFRTLQLSQVPRTLNGKVDVRRLQEMVVLSSSSELSSKPTSQVGQCLAEVWAKILGCNVDLIRMETSFFELPNGNSISAVRVVNSLNALGYNITASKFFQLQTIAQLEDLLGSISHERPDVSLRSFSDQTSSIVTQLCVHPGVIEDIMPATPLQSGMLVAAMKDRRKYTGAQLWEIPANSSVNVSGLCTAWERLVKHHTILRTRFVVLDEGIFQVVLDRETASTMSPVVMAAGAEVDVHSWAAEALKVELDRGFAIADPMARFSIITKDDVPSRILLTMSHAIYDGWSLGILESDLKRFYVSEPSTVCPPFSSFVRHIKDQAGDDAQQYWTNYLSGIVPSPPLQLPPQVLSLSVEGQNTITRTLSVSTEQLRQAAIRMRVTPAILANAAWAIVLKRFLGQSEIVFGNVLSGRDADIEGIESMVGMLLTTVPVRASITKDTTVEDLVKDLHFTHSNHLEYCHAGLINIQRWSNMPKIFSTLVTFGNASDQGSNSEDALTIRRLAGKGDVSEYGADVSFFPTASGLDVEIVSDSGLLDTAASRSIVEELDHIFQCIVSPSRAHSPISLIPLSPGQTEKFHVFGDGGIATRPFETLHAGVTLAASKYPHAVALEHYDTFITYAELESWSNCLAYALQQHQGGVKGKFCGLLVERSIEFVVGMLAIMKAGLAFVPLDCSFPDDRLVYMVEAAEVGPILTTRRALKRKERIVEGHVVTFMEDLRTGQNVNPQNVATGDDRSYIIFSSGTTGKPKPIVCRHAGAVNNILFHPCMKHIHPGTRIGQMLAISFDGTLQEVFGGLFLGATVVLREENVFHTIKTLDVLSLTPSGLQQLDPNEYTNLKCVFTCGEALPTSLVQRWGPRVALYSDYGPTECCISTSCNTKPYSEDMPITLGRPFPNMSMYVLDSESKLPVPMGVIGELHIGGVGVGEGYYGRSELTEAKFIRNPFVSVHAPANMMYCAGDLVRWLPHGELQFCGRDDTQVKLKGYRIELEEVATVMRSVPGVKDAVALIRSSDNGNILVGFVSSPSVDVEDVRGTCIMALPIYEVPAIVIRLDEFPVTSIGKVDRAVLQHFDLANASKEETKTLSDKELAVQRAFVATLRISPDLVHASTSFFALGGDSISAIKLVSKAKDEHLLVNVQQVFRYPTVEALAACAQVLAADSVPKAEIDIVGDVPLSAAQVRYLRNASQVDHFNQSHLLRLRRAVYFKDFLFAMYHLVKHHDMLRARFRKQSGGWKQSVVPFDELDVDGQVKVLEIGGNLETELKRINQTLNIVDGPLYVGALIQYQQEQYIYITIHHLVVDIVSFNVILDDLEKLLSGQALGSKTTSFAECVTQLSKKTEHFDALAWNRHLANTKAADDVVVNSTVPSGRMQNITVSISQDLSSHVNSANNAYRTNTQDLAISALALASYSLFGSSPFALSLESHGRDVNVLTADTSRTVGWFTASYPVCLDLSESTNDLRKAVMQVKEVIRNVPDGGMSYELLKYTTSTAGVSHVKSHRLAHIEFNFFGEAAQSGDLFEDIPVSLEVDVHPANLDIGIIASCYIKNGALELDFYFDTGLYESSVLESLGQQWKIWMEKVVQHCNEPTSFGYTPSDFTAFQSDQSVLEEIEVEITGLGITLQDIEDIWPATSAQTAFFMSLMHGGEKYVSQTVYELKGTVDDKRISRAWECLLAANPVLRSGFVSTSGGVFQIVSKSSVPNPVEWLEWNGANAENSQAEFLLNNRQRFSSTSPFFTSLTAIRVGKTECRLIFTQFHAVSDGWSHTLEMDDFLTAFVNGRLSQRYPSFKEYADHLTRLDSIDTHDYWRAVVGEGRKCASWTFAQPLTNGNPQSHRDHDRRVENVSEGLANAASSTGVTLSTLLRALWALVLRHYTDTKDVIFGAVVSGRDTFEDAENIIGTLVNTVPVTAHLDETETLGSLLQKLHQQHVDSLAHSHASLSDIMKWNAVTDLPSFFNTLFTFQNYPSFSAPGTLPFSISPIAATEYTEFDINMNIFVVDHDIEITASYDTLKLESHHVESMVDKFAELLTDVVKPEAMTTSLEKFNQVSAADLRRLEAIESGPVAPLPYECLHHGFEYWASIQPDAIAVEQGTDKLTYGQLDAFANDLAARLQRLGVGPGDFVPLVTIRCPDMVIAIMAILKTGAAYAPIDKEYPLDRIEYIIQTCQPKVVLCHPSTQTAVPNFENLSFELISVSRKGIPTEKPVQPLLTRDHPAYVIFTSGTTGKPKGVVCLHRGVVNVVMLSPTRFGTKPGSRGASILSVSFDMGTWEVQSCLFNGATVVMRTDDFFDVFKTVDTVFITPSALARLTPDQLTNVKHVAVSGEPCPAALKEEWTRRLHFHNSCAPSETTIVSFLGEMCPDERISMGPPIENASCYLLNPVTLERVPFGCTGEIFISGVCVGAGYLNNPELTAKSFLPDPRQPGGIMFRSGDLGRWTSWGSVEHLGRKDDQVKVKGFRVELLEVMAGLRRHADVTGSVVLIKDGNLVAFVTPEDVDVKEVEKTAASFLPPYMIPSTITAVKSFPLNQNGKVDKKALLAIETLISNDDMPTGELERMFADVWATILKIDVHRISRKSTFHELGGDSISALRIVAAAKKRGFSVKSAQVANRKHTLADLATLATSTATPASTPVFVSFDSTSPIPLTPVMRWFFSLNWKNINWWNQSFLLIPRIHITPENALNAVKSLVSHHEILRARYALKGSEWIQTIESMSSHRIPVHFMSLTSFSEIESEVKRFQQRINIEDGPLYQVALFDDGREQRLWISVHHICIDLVSWRILTEDLEHLLNGEQLGQPTTSFALWSHHLLKHASTLDPQLHIVMEKQLKIDNAAFVQKLMRPDALTLDQVESSDHIGVGCVSVPIKLGVEDLLNAANARLDTNDQDLILAALLMSMRTHLGSLPVPLAVVSHGRMPWNDDFDVSRTTGWFSTSNGSPCTFSLPAAEDVKALVEYTRSALAMTAQNGFNYQALRWMTSSDGADRLGQAEAQVGFNYFGRWQVFASQKAHFQEDVTSLGNTWNNCEGEILHIPFSVIGQLTSFGELEVSAEFYSDIFDTATVLHIIGGWKDYMFQIFQAAGLSPAPGLFDAPVSVSDTSIERVIPTISITPPMSLPPPGDESQDHEPEPHMEQLPTPGRNYLRRTHSSTSVTLVPERDGSKERSEREHSLDPSALVTLVGCVQTLVESVAAGVRHEHSREPTQPPVMQTTTSPVVPLLVAILGVVVCMNVSVLSAVVVLAMKA